jgi:hypothetical protein
MRDRARWAALLAGAWLGLLLTVAGIATPAAFATLPTADAGRVAARVLAAEAYASLALAVAMALLERARARADASAGAGSQFGAGLALALGALFCTVLGYFGVLPWMADARAGSGRFTFAQLHAASSVLYAVKVLLVAALAWRATRVEPAVLKPASSSD